jgi:hypothetical protein
MGDDDGVNGNRSSPAIVLVFLGAIFERTWTGKGKYYILICTHLIG